LRYLTPPEHVHATTIREAFDNYQRQRVNIAGETIGYDPDAPTAAAEWVKHNLSRIRDSLPNGYCGRPPQQDCPHPNACLTCPDFQTTPEFLGTHRRQATEPPALPWTVIPLVSLVPGGTRWVQRDGSSRSSTRRMRFSSIRIQA
jgi:hypothetical protein